jgi:hypothetical protein
MSSTAVTARAREHGRNIRSSAAAGIEACPTHVPSGHCKPSRLRGRPWISVAIHSWFSDNHQNHWDGSKETQRGQTDMGFTAAGTVMSAVAARPRLGGSPWGGRCPMEGRAAIVNLRPRGPGWRGSVVLARWKRKAKERDDTKPAEQLYHPAGRYPPRQPTAVCAVTNHS